MDAGTVTLIAVIALLIGFWAGLLLSVATER